MENLPELDFEFRTSENSRLIEHLERKSQMVYLGYTFVGMHKNERASFKVTM